MIGPDEEGSSHLMKDTSSISMCSIEIVMPVLLVYNLCGPLGLGKSILFLYYF